MSVSRGISIEPENRDQKPGWRSNVMRKTTNWVDVEEFRCSWLVQSCIYPLFLPSCPSTHLLRPRPAPRRSSRMRGIRNSVRLFSSSPTKTCCPCTVVETNTELRGWRRRRQGQRGWESRRMETFPLFFSFIIYVSPSTRLRYRYRLRYVNSQPSFCRPLCNALCCLIWPAFVRLRLKRNSCVDAVASEVSGGSSNFRSGDFAYAEAKTISTES